MNRPAPGTITWVDLTTKDAASSRDFYEKVVGWTHQSVEIDGYEDFCMDASNGSTVAGICHALGENSDIPPVWMVYINVSDAESSAVACIEEGGEIVQPIRLAGDGKTAILKDPDGVVFGIFQKL